MKIKQEEVTGWIGSAIFCIIIALILYFTFLRTEMKSEEMGTLVNFGTIDWAAGTFEPRPEVPNREIPNEQIGRAHV